MLSRKNVWFYFRLLVNLITFVVYIHEKDAEILVKSHIISNLCYSVLCQ